MIFKFRDVSNSIFNLSGFVYANQPEHHICLYLERVQTAIKYHNAQEAEEDYMRLHSFLVRKF